MMKRKLFRWKILAKFVEKEVFLQRQRCWVNQIVRSQSCWGSSGSNSPSYCHGIPTITPWRSQRTHPWYANICVMRISGHTAPVWLTSSVPYFSISTSISTGHISFRRHPSCQGKRAQEISLFKDVMIFYEKLRLILEASEEFKEGVTFKQLDAQAAKMSDNDADLAMNNARKNGLKTFLRRWKSGLKKMKSARQS